MHRDVQKTTLGNSRNELLHAQTFMNPDLFDLLKEIFFLEQLPKLLRKLCNRTTEAPKEAMDTGAMTAEELA